MTADLPSKLAAARETLARATPGPLVKWGKPDPAQAVAVSGRLIGTTVGGNDDANADIHILAVNALPALLDVAEAVEEIADYARHTGTYCGRVNCDCGYREARAALDAALARLAEAL